MLPKRYRLHKNRDIKRVMQKGQRLFEGDLRLHLLTNTRQTNPRFTFLVSTKVHKRSTVRNRLKRQLRGSVNHYLHDHQLPIRDIVIAISRYSTNSDFNRDLSLILAKMK